MHDETLLKKLEKLVGSVGPKAVQSALIRKDVCASVAERLAKNQFRKYASKPSRKTRQAILEVLEEKAS